MSISLEHLHLLWQAILHSRITRNTTTSNIQWVNIRDSICLRVWPRYNNKFRFNIKLKSRIIIIILTKFTSAMETNRISWVSNRKTRHQLQISMRRLSSSPYHTRAWKIIRSRNMGSLISTTSMKRRATKEWSNISTWEKLKAPVHICRLITSIKVWPEHLRDGPYQKWTGAYSRKNHRSLRDLWNTAQILLNSKRPKQSSRCPKLREISPFPSMEQPIQNSCQKASSERWIIASTYHERQVWKTKNSKLDWFKREKIQK